MSESDEKDLLPGIVAGFLMLLVIFMVDGWVLSTMWGWFVVPLGVQQIGVAHAIGLSTLVGLMTGVLSQASKDDVKQERKPVWSRLLSGVALRFFVLGLGWVFHQFMIG